MTDYELLCCFKSPNWCNYQNLLDPKYQFIPSNIEQTLPQSATDSYLGRLLNLARVVNNSIDTLTIDSLDLFTATIEIFNKSGVMWGRTLSPKMKIKICRFLDLGLPVSWIHSLLSVFTLELWSGKGPQTLLNDKRFLETLCELQTVAYIPVQQWFRLHPKAISVDTNFREVD